MLERSRDGFSLIEMIIAILILTGAVLGIASSTGGLVASASESELEFSALQSVEDRLALIRLDPRYGLLDSIFSGTETALPGLHGLTRTTRVTRSRVEQDEGSVLDYTTVVVTVSGDRLRESVSRKLVLGAP
jgi:prepilin-type N-terminal cleavage/methylation domain-containing protein